MQQTNSFRLQACKFDHDYPLLSIPLTVNADGTIEPGQFFRLQQLWISECGGIKEWRNINIEWTQEKSEQEE